MIRILASFLLTDLNQVPKDLIKKGIYLEGNIFNCDFLKNDDTWKLIDRNLKYLEENYGNVVKSLHFPVENANYLESSHVKDILYRFIEISSNHNIQTIVLHSNYIQNIETFNVDSINSARRKFIEFYSKLDIFLSKTKVSIGIENMPIIGNQGVDFDSIFVFPTDFNDFNFKNIHITWDFGHWAYTYFVIETLNNFSTIVKVKKIKFKDYLKLESQIIHAHFSSFKGTTYPDSNSLCSEGIPPVEGDFDLGILTNLIIELSKQKEKINLTLEIKEDDYTHRKNIYKVISWINKITRE